MERKKKTEKRILALALCAALLTTQFPATAMGENPAPEEGEIVSFQQFPVEVARQTVPVGTELEELNLPETIKAEISHPAGDADPPDGDLAEGGEEGGEGGETAPAATPSNASAGASSRRAVNEGGGDPSPAVSHVATSEETLSVEWGEGEPSYDSGAAGLYVFTADVGGYALAPGVKPPTITVTIEETGEGAPEMMEIIAFDELDAGVRTQTVMAGEGAELERLALPDTLRATGVAGEPLTVVNVEWESDRAYDPEAIGTYVFTSKAAGCALAGEAAWPRITVTVWEMSLRTINDRHTVDGLIYKEVGRDAVQLIGPTTFTGDLEVPEQIMAAGKTFHVRSIGDNAFYGSGLTGVSLPEGLESIGGFAFEGCQSLTGELVLPSTVRSIGRQAFSDCSSLTGELSLPSTVRTIREYAFSGSGLTGVNLQEGLESIGMGAFSNCPNLTGGLRIPSTVRSIGEYAFSGSGLTGVNLQEGLESIGAGVFSNCPNLTGGLRIPSTVRSIGEYAFSGSGLTGVSLPEGLESIGEYAFSRCLNLTGELRIPSTVTSIGYGAFPENVITVFRVGSSEVAGLLRDIGVDSARITLFDGSAPVFPISIIFLSGGAEYTVTEDDTVALTRYSGAGAIEIPKTVSYNNRTYRVTSIGHTAFFGSGITDLTLPEGLEEIDSFAFGDCRNLTVPLTIPSTVTSIGVSAFIRSGITGLTLQEGLETIGSNAFWSCQNLTAPLAIPSTVTSIRDGAFFGNGITDLTLPEGLEEIDSFAFSNCQNLTVPLTIPSTVTSIGGSAFFGSGITDLTLLEGLEEIEGYAFDACQNLTVPLTIPSTVTSIGENAFFSAGITKAHIKGKLEFMGIAAFSPDLPIQCDEPETQLLVVQALNLTEGNLPSVSWDGKRDIPPSAAVTVDKNIEITGGVTICGGAEATIVGGAKVTIGPEGALVVEPDAILDGYGIIEVEYGGTLTGEVGENLTVIYRVSGDSDSSENGGSYVGPAPKSVYQIAGDRINQTIFLADLRKLAESGTRLTLNCDKARMDFAPAALNAILASVPVKAGAATFQASPADLSASQGASQLIGSRPAYDFSISYQEDGGSLLPAKVDFPAGSASVSLAHTPAAGEAAGNLFMVHIAGEGTVTWLDRSVCDSGWMVADAPHFSVYGVACRANAPVAAGLDGHWAKEDIEWAAARGLLTEGGEESSGAGGEGLSRAEKQGGLSPDAAITRGMLVTALGRLAGVDPDRYRSCSFTDVEGDAGCAPYAEWAAQNGVVDGSGGAFRPDAPVTREEMAVFLTRYAGQAGYTLPDRLAPAPFADDDEISEWAVNGTAAMQRSGVMRAREGNRFAPRENATRAEASAALRRLVETSASPEGLADGWLRNDSGRWMHYQGEPYGWRQLDGRWYYFYETGEMAADAEIDGFAIGPDGVWREP